MTKIKLFLLTFTFLLSISPTALAQKGRASELIPGPGQQNEMLAIEALKEIYKAEAAFFWPTFAFGSLDELRNGGLIDKGLGAGERYGYTFTLFATHSSTQEPARFRVWATPKMYGRTGNRSFYMTNTCLISGADKGGANADQNDPIVDQCTPTIAYEFERHCFLGIQAVRGAEFTYMATTGNGFFGTHNQLIDAQFLTAPYGVSGNWWGYHSWVVSPSASPVGFKAWSTPMYYRESGMSSFYADETGVIRGADRQGRRARETDPPIDIPTSADPVVNERMTYYLLNGIVAAEQWFSNWGTTNYGTFHQLELGNFFKIPMQIDRFQGYVYTLTLVPRNGTTPPHFEVSAVPEQYGVTGVRSLYIDENRMVRGGDKNGAPANAQDPRIFFIQ